jgi:hypothetical protein
MRRACVRVETTVRNVLFVPGSVRRFKGRGTPGDGGRGSWYRVGVRIVTVPQRAQPALLLAVGLPRRGRHACT